MVDARSSNQGFWVVAAGIVAVLIILLVCILKMKDPSASELTAILGSATSVIGTIVGAFFGIHAGASGREKAEEKRDEAENRANAMRGLLSSEQTKKLREEKPHLFQSFL